MVKRYSTDANTPNEPTLSNDPESFDLIAHLSGASLGDTESAYFDAVSETLTSKANASHVCSDACGILPDPHCPLWEGMRREVLNLPRRDPRYQAVAMCYSHLAARLESDQPYAQAVEADIRALANSADLLGDVFLRLFRRAWQGSTPEEQAELFRLLAPLVRELIREELLAAQEGAK